MLRWKRVEISAGALLLGAALYYLDEQGVLLMAFCACALHELGQDEESIAKVKDSYHAYRLMQRFPEAENVRKYAKETFNLDLTD